VIEAKTDAKTIEIPMHILHNLINTKEIISQCCMRGLHDMDLKLQLMFAEPTPTKTVHQNSTNFNCELKNQNQGLKIDSL